jgi:hypothetical protein
MDEHDVVELTCNEDRSRVTGVSISSRQSDEKRLLTADLVVDATGRGSRMPTFSESLGYDRPVEDEVVMRLAYTSQLLRIPPGMYNELLVLTGPVPGRPSGMALFTYEGNTWLLTRIGLAGLEPPADFAGMLRFIADLTPPEVLSARQCAEPLGEWPDIGLHPVDGAATTRCGGFRPVCSFSVTRYAASIQFMAKG